MPSNCEGTVPCLPNVCTQAQVTELQRDNSALTTRVEVLETTLRELLGLPAIREQIAAARRDIRELFDEIPDETLAIICSFLGVREMGRLARVARRFVLPTLSDAAGSGGKLSPINEGARQAVARHWRSKHTTYYCRAGETWKHILHRLDMQIACRLHGVVETLACPRGLQLTQNAREKVEARPGKGGCALIEPLPVQWRPATQKDVFYYEVTVIDGGDRNVVAVGFAPEGYTTRTHRRLPRFPQPGWDQGSVGYHGDDGGLFVEQGSSAVAVPLANGAGTFGAGDTIGCGCQRISPEDEDAADVRYRVFFTSNGEDLAMSAEVSSRYPMHACIGLKYGARVEVNMGHDHFLYGAWR
jgi:hypothetical protein